MNAKEARRITDKNIIPLELILKNIESYANNGKSSLAYEQLPQEHIIGLIRLGFKISDHTGPDGLKWTVVEW